MIGKLAPSVVCALVLGFVSTFGDWLWNNFVPDGSIVAGVIHGVLIFLILAVVLGWAAGTRRAYTRLVPTLPLAGLAIAAGFYPVAYAVGYLGALLVTWVVMWLTLAALQRWAREGSEPLARALLRGGVAAVASGLAFGSIAGIWTNPSPETNYLLRFGIWTYAFLPGFLALLLGQPGRGR